MRLIYSPSYEIDLGAHVWPTSKYRLVVERLGIAWTEPSACGWDDLALVHTADYLRKVRTGTLTPDEIATLELPWSPGMADGFRLMTGGTCMAAEAALEDGGSVHVGGGLHHAFANHGEGFCLFNDVAVAIRRLQRGGRIARAAVVDCDVHHGNGTAMIFGGDPTVFTFSVHQQHNYPLFKPASDLDIGLRDGAGDAEYLDRLHGALAAVMRSHPQLIVYLAGADPLERDRLGGLKLTKSGLRARDRMVVEASRSEGLPIVTVFAGGYAEDVEDTVDVHVATVEEMLKFER